MTYKPPASAATISEKNNNLILLKPPRYIPTQVNTTPSPQPIEPFESTPNRNIIAPITTPAITLHIDWYINIQFATMPPIEKITICIQLTVRFLISIALSNIKIKITTILIILNPFCSTLRTASILFHGHFFFYGKHIVFQITANIYHMISATILGIINLIASYLLHISTQTA